MFLLLIYVDLVILQLGFGMLTLMIHHRITEDQLYCLINLYLAYIYHQRVGIVMLLQFIGVYVCFYILSFYCLFFKFAPFLLYHSPFLSNSLMAVKLLQVVMMGLLGYGLWKVK